MTARGYRDVTVEDRGQHRAPRGDLCTEPLSGRIGKDLGGTCRQFGATGGTGPGAWRPETEVLHRDRGRQRRMIAGQHQRLRACVRIGRSVCPEDHQRVLVHGEAGSQRGRCQARAGLRDPFDAARHVQLALPGQYPPHIVGAHWAGMAQRRAGIEAKPRTVAHEQGQWPKVLRAGSPTGHGVVVAFQLRADRHRVWPRLWSSHSGIEPSSGAAYPAFMDKREVGRATTADDVHAVAARARDAAAELGTRTRAAKDAALHAMADALDDAHRGRSSPRTRATSRPGARRGWPRR